MTLSALVSLFFGIVGLLATEPLATFGGFVKSVPSAGLGEFLAASYLGYGVMNWFARDTRDPGARRAIAFGNLAGWSLSLALALGEVLTGGAHTFGWPTVVLCAVFSAGWGYFAMQRARAHAHLRVRDAAG